MREPSPRVSPQRSGASSASTVAICRQHRSHDQQRARPHCDDRCRDGASPRLRADALRAQRRQFDVTSGVLRRAWRFDGSERVPSREPSALMRALVGWQKVRWRAPELTLKPGMEVDLGGIGKEYAVDRAAALARPLSAQCLLNFGGDLLALGPAVEGRPWRVGVESLDESAVAARQIDLVSRRARDERRCTPILAQGRTSVTATFSTHDRLARRGRAALGDGCRSDCTQAGHSPRSRCSAVGTPRPFCLAGRPVLVPALSGAPIRCCTRPSVHQHALIGKRSQSAARSDVHAASSCESVW